MNKVQTKDKYINLYKEYHSNKNNYQGVSYGKEHQKITELVRETKSQTLLDYGCGKATQYHLQGLHHDFPCGMPTLYDPAVPEYSTLPDGPFDGIYSTDVMEHIPEEVIPSVFEYIFGNAQKFVYLAICTRLANAILPNGENAHCTVKPMTWWVDMVEKHAPKKVLTHIRTYGDDNNYKVLTSMQN